MTTEFLGITLVLSVLGALLVAIPVWRYRNTEHTKRSLAATVILIVALPLAVLALYTRVTSYPWDNPERLEMSSAMANAPLAEQILAMVGQLEERMATEPTVEGMAMLGRSYVNLERFEDGVKAYHQAWELAEGNDPTVNLGYAEALLLADRNTIMTSAGDLLDRALMELPNNPKALWYGGMSSVARGNMEQAQQRLAHLLNQPDIPEQLRTVVQQQLAALGAEGPAEAGDDAADAASAQISTTISLSPELKNTVQASAVLFVFARETGQPGPPIAVKRIPAPSFPLTVTLSDKDSMMGNNTLSSVKNLTLVARISNSGNATATSGDIYGETQPDWPGDSASIDIDSTVP